MNNAYTENIIPIMSDYDKPRGKVTFSSEFDSRYKAWQLFNGTVNNIYDCWASTTVQGWVSYDFVNSSPTVTKYSMTARNDNNLSESLKSWNFEGSNDGEHWEVLDERRKEDKWGNKEYREYEINNKNSYRMYRINVLENHGNSYSAFSLLEMYETNQRFLISCKGELYTLEEGAIVISPSQELSQSNFMNHGFVNPFEITEEQWLSLSDDKTKLKLLLWTNDISKVEAQAKCKVEPYRPYDKLDNEFEICMLTDKETI